MYKRQEEEWKAIEFMTDCLEDSGFFTMKPEEVANECRLPLESVDVYKRQVYFINRRHSFMAAYNFRSGF